MMDYDSQLKVQAYLDGELPEPQAREVADQLARDPQSAALLDELRNTRQAFKDSETTLRLPESGEFFWSKIKREIQRHERPEPVHSPRSVLAQLQRLLVPASAVALLAVVLTLSVSRSAATQPGEMELVSDDMGALTFRSQSERMTMVWLYPRSDSQLASAAPPIDFDPE